MGVLSRHIRSFALKMPKEWHPYLKDIRNYFQIRYQAVLKGRRILASQRIMFLGTEIADLEPFEFLSPGPNELLINVTCNALSFGTELASFVGALPKGFPYWPGYSGAGIVQHVGKNVKEINIGDRVTGQFKNAKHVVVDAEKVFRIPDVVNMEEASFIEMGIIVLQAVRKANIQPGDSVLVIGQGIIGQLAVRLARLAGGCPVYASASSRKRQSIALSNGGADEFLLVTDPMSNIADVVIEASGAPGTFAKAIASVKPKGKVVLLGSARMQETNIEVNRYIQNKNLHIVGAHISVLPSFESTAGYWTYRKEGELFIELLENKILSIIPIITDRWLPEEINRKYELLLSGEITPVGGLLKWN